MIKVTLAGTSAGLVLETAPVTASLATDEDLRSVRYQWAADGQVLATTAEDTYVPTDADVGKTISVTLLYADPAGAAHEVAGSNSLTVLDVEDRPTGGISVLTDPRDPNLLHVFNVLADADGMAAVSYQWQVDGQAVAGATGSDYMLTADQQGKHVTVVASWIDGRGHAESVSSDQQLGIYDDRWGQAMVSGSRAPGQTLHVGAADADGLGTVYTSWETSTDGVTWTALPGASGPDLALGAAVPELLRASVTYADNRGYVETHRVVLGGDCGNTVETGAGESIVLGAGADTIVYHGGTGTVDGGAGLDTFVGPAMYLAHTPGQGVGTTNVWNEGAYGAHLVDVERVVLGGQGTAYDTDGAAGQAYRLYEAAFDRTPEQFGLGFWISRLDAGVALADVAGAFVVSDEFKSLYGAAPTNADLVGNFYANVLHRAPDAVGQAFWTDVLDRHAASVADVLLQFSESPENIAALVGTIQNGIAYLPYTGA